MAITLSSAFWAQQPAVAQIDGNEAEEIEEVTVTATRLPTMEQELPFAYSRIGRDEIQLARQQLGLDEALAGVPGLFFQNRYNFAQDLRIAIRGFGARANFGIRGIRLIADDIPLTLPDGQGSVDSIDLGSAETIEVIRGPFSAVYGAASGGVILIRSETGPTEPFVAGRLNLGDYGFAQGQLKFGGQSGAFDYMANLSHTTLDGYRDHSATKNTLLNSRIRYEIDDSTRLTVVVNVVHSPEADDPGALNSTEVSANRRQAAPRNIAFDAGESLDQQALGAALSRRYAGGSELLLRAHYSHRDFANRLPFDINANGQGGSVELGRNFYGVGGHWSVGLGPGMRLVVGAEYEAQRDHRRRFANDLGVLGPLTTDQDEDVTDYAVFAELSWTVSQAIAARFGVRYDAIDYDVIDRLDLGGSGETDFSAFSPMAGMTWQVGDRTTLYTNVSRSFDPPATTELANPSAPTGFNQDLEEQSAMNFELGLKGEGAGRWQYELAMFHIDVDDAIVPFELSGTGQTFFENAGSASHDGIEAGLTIELAEGLTASASYTWSDFEFDHFQGLGGESFDGNRIPGIPEHLVQAGVSWQPAGALFLGFDVLHAAHFFADNANQVEVGDYTVADMRLEYRWRGPRLEVSPFAGINNIFDEKYDGNIRLNASFGRYFEPAPERNVYAGVEVRLAR